MATYKKYTSGAKLVQHGFGQVEPNHISAGYTGAVMAQLPAAADIEILENGQFVKYDQANKEVNFTGKGPWVMVYNEIQNYLDYQTTADFAMIRDNYAATVYSPIAQDDSNLNTGMDYTGTATNLMGDPYQKTLLALKQVGLMPAGTTMVPRCVMIELGDWYTTNCINEDSIAVGDTLQVGADGYLATSGDSEGPTFIVDKVYTLADGQPAAKIRRIA